MAVLACLLVFASQSLLTSASQFQANDHNSEAVLSSGGKIIGVGKQRKGMMRRDESPADENSAMELKQQRMYGVLDEADRDAKIKRGAASSGQKDPWDISVGKHANTGANHRPWHSAPDWAPHASMPTMPTCTQDVTQEMGLSDYGSISHSCSSCQRNCTEENKQQATNLTWLFEPALSTCNAFDVKLYANWSSIDQLGCTNCEGKGIRHKFEMSFATNAGEGLTGYEDKALSFEAWMGPEVQGGPRGSGSDFSGFHVFEVEDTEEPSHSENCDAANPPGRWLAIPGELRAGETFQCERYCKRSPCKCGRNTGMRCKAGIAMSSSQLFAYRVRSIAESATGTLDGNSYVGTEWEVTAEDLTQASPVMTVGRVILAGNSAVYGIKDLRQSHQKIGCVPCDLFYESTIISGPFIEDPVGVHVIRSADGQPPTLTSESCELFRISALSGFSVMFESGPGLWPPFEVNDTIFTCSHSSTNTCPA